MDQSNGMDNKDNFNKQQALTIAGEHQRECRVAGCPEPDPWEADCWQFTPSRLALCYYAFIYALFLALIVLLAFYQRQSPVILCLALLFMFYPGFSDYRRLKEARETMLLRYQKGNWFASRAMDNNQSRDLMNVGVRAPGEIRVLVKSQLCIVLQFESGLESEKYKFLRPGSATARSRIILWRDQLSYDKWRLLCSRLSS